ATTDLQGHAMVALDDLATLFQLTVREDAAARAVTVSYKNQTIVLTPDQTLASMSGRLVSLPAPLTRQGRRWLLPVEFVSRGDALDAALTPPPQNGLATAVRATEPNTIQLDLGPRFASYRSSTPTSAGASAQLVLELLPIAAESSAVAPPSATPPSAAAGNLP